MKKWFILAMVIFIVRPLFSQEKGVNTIIVKVDTVGIFDKLTNILYDKGYSIETSDPKNGVLFSTAKTVDVVDVKLRMRVKDSLVYISGVAALNIELDLGMVKSTKSWEVIRNAGAKGSGLIKSWNEMNSFAEQVGTPIEYAKR